MTNQLYKKFLAILKKINKLELKSTSEGLETCFKQGEYKAYKFAYAVYGYEQANQFDWEARNSNRGRQCMYTLLKQSFIVLQGLKNHNELRAKRSKKSKYKLTSLDG